MHTLSVGGHTRIGWAEPSSLAGREERAILLLSPAERVRLETTVSPAARSRFLWGRMLARELVGARAGADPGAVAIEARCPDCGGPHGRPVVAGPDDRARALSLSISGCPGMIVVAISDRPRIGIDVEPRAGASDRLEAIREVAGTAADPLRHWTRAEAVLKADGRGLRVDPRRLRFHGDRVELDGVRYRVDEPVVDPGFVVSVAIGSPPPPGGAAGPAGGASRRAGRRAGAG